MAKCAYCGAETELYDGETPICIKCSEKLEMAIPSGLPHPDGTQRIRNASNRQLTIARNEMTRAFPVQRLLAARDRARRF